jgi:hypothetical protein
MPPKIAKLAGLGAFAACLGLLALFALIIYFTRSLPQGGLPPVLAYLTWLSLAVVFACLIAVHIAIGKQLLYIAKGGGPTRL